MAAPIPPRKSTSLTDATSPDKAIFLMEGFDLRSVLDQRVDLRRLLKAKISALNLEAEPYMSVARLLA